MTVYRPSRIHVYPLHHLTLPTSMSILDKLLSYSYQGQDNGIAAVSYSDKRHHVAPRHRHPAIMHLKKGHIVQTAGCTLINPTGCIASLTYNGAQFWKQLSKARTRPPSQTHTWPCPLCNAWKAVVSSLKCGQWRPKIPCPALIHTFRIQ